MPGQNDRNLLIRFNEKSRENKSYKVELAKCYLILPSVIVYGYCLLVQIVK